MPPAISHALTPAMWAHLLTVLPALAIGTVLMVRRKGTPAHVWLGRFYMLLMLATAIVSFWVRGLNGDHLSPIHALSAWTIVSVLAGWWAIRTGRRRTHRNFMIGLYIGALVAGAFALLPARVLGGFLFG